MPLQLFTHRDIGRRPSCSLCRRNRDSDPAPCPCPTVCPGVRPWSRRASWGPGRTPPCKHPCRCYWDRRTNRTPSSPDTRRTSSDLSSSGLWGRRGGVVFSSAQNFTGKYQLVNATKKTNSWCPGRILSFTLSKRLTAMSTNPMNTSRDPTPLIYLASLVLTFSLTFSIHKEMDFSTS